MEREKEDNLGKQWAKLQGKYGSTLELCDGGIRIWRKLNCCGHACCFCIGWNIDYFVVPKQCILNVSVEAKSQCCCFPLCCLDCCRILTTDVIFECIDIHAKRCYHMKGGKFVDERVPTTLKQLEFKWNKDEAKQNATILHDYVYGHISASCVDKCHNDAHMVNTGLVHGIHNKVAIDK